MSYTGLELEIVKMALEMAVSESKNCAELAKERGESSIEESLLNAVGIYDKVLDKTKMMIAEVKKNGEG